MPTTPLTSDQYDIVLSGGYRATEYVVVCPSTVVFAARVNGTPTVDVINAIPYDTVTVGAYTDLHIGQAVLVSATSNIRDAFFRSMVRITPTASILYVNATSDNILDEQYIFVIDSYDIAETDRPAQFHEIPPTIKSADDDHPLQSAYVALTDEATATFDLSVVMQCLTKGATEGTYHWIIPDGTITVGTDTDPAITIEVDVPYNRWGRLEYEDSEGTANWFAFTLSAGDPNNPAHDFFRLCHEPVDYSADENGYTASVSYWEGVDDLLDQTRVAIVADERYNDGDAELGNVRFVGYFSDDSGDVRGDEKFGQLKNATINLAGFSQLAGENKFQALAITHKTAPVAWGEINTPTPARAAGYVLTYSTLPNLAPIDWGEIDDTYFAGNMDTEDSSVLDAAQKLGQKITASFMQDGSGQLVWRRNANFLTTDERDALEYVTPEPITLGEGMSFTLKHTHRRRVSAVNVSYTVYSTLTGEQINIAAIAPANGAGTGPEQSGIPPQILAPQADLEDALEEARQRAGHWLEYVNPVDLLTVNLSDEFGFISPSLHQWYNFDIPAADLPRGVAIATTDRWLCISIAPRLNARGGRDIQAVFRRESVGGKANIFVAVVPNVTDTSLNVMPGFPSYGGDWSPAPSINYDTVDPDVQQPFDADDLGQTLPLPAEQGAGQGAGMPPPGCYVQSPPINFKNSSNVSSAFITQLGADYTLNLSGSARIETGYEVCTDLTASDGGWIATDSAGTPNPAFGFWDSGAGLAPHNPTQVFFFTLTPIPGLIISSITFTFNEGSPAWRLGKQGGAAIDYSGPAVTTVTFDTVSHPTFFPLSLASPVYITPSGFNLAVTTTFRVTQICIDAGTYTEPLYGDAFYQGEENPDGSGTWTNVQLLNPSGLMLDNSLYLTPPPFNPNHEYTIPFTGTGNVLLSRWHDANGYENNQNLNLNLTICGPGAGT